MSDGVIDISKYLKEPPSGGGRGFSVWGGEGERARFALPIWRAVYLLEGDRGAIGYRPEGTGSELHPAFVLDLAEDPARTSLPNIPAPLLTVREPPSVALLSGGGAVIFLGRESDRSWFLFVLGGEEKESLSGRRREDLFFLAGECAGLLFFRGFSEEMGES